MRLVPVGSTPGGLRRCNLPGAFDLIGAPCDCPCSASGAGRAGLALQRFRDFLLEIAEVERPAVALSASFVGNADVGERIARKPSIPYCSQDTLVSLHFGFLRLR